MRRLIRVVGVLVATGLVAAAGTASADAPPTVKKDKGAANPTAAAADKGAASTRPPDPELKKGAFPLPKDLPAHARFVLIDLHDEVTLGMAAFVKRVVGSFNKDDILVVDINTFGGRVDAAVQIADALKSVRGKGAFALAYIHPRAISAGALISYACDIIVVAPGATMGAATPISIEGGKAKAVGEKFVSYMRTEMGAIAKSKGRKKAVAEAMVDNYQEVDGLIDRGKLLTLDGDQALQWYVASFKAESLDKVITELGYKQAGRSYTTKEMHWSWAEKLAAWLSSSMVSGLLMTIGMLGLMLGLYTGGNPIPLVVGGACLMLFFFGAHVVDLAGIEEILLFVVGIGLIIFETIVPGHLVSGVVGLILVVGALIMGLINLDTVPAAVQWQQGWILSALATVFGSILATTILAYAAFKLMPDTKFGRRLIMDAAIDGRATGRVDSDNDSVVGREGVADTDLRPSGRIKVDGKRYDAVARHGHIAKGDPVKVVSVRGFSVVVTKLVKEESA